jgi:hypothetical protein
MSSCDAEGEVKVGTYIEAPPHGTPPSVARMRPVALITLPASSQHSETVFLPASTSELDPDLVLAEIRPDCYAREHPQPGQVMLVVEVAESSLEYDRQVKAPS